MHDDVISVNSLSLEILNLRASSFELEIILGRLDFNTLKVNKYM